MLQNVHI